MPPSRGVIDSVRIRFQKKGNVNRSNHPLTKIVVKDTGEIKITSLEDKFRPIHLNTANVRKPERPYGHYPWIELKILQNKEAEFKYVEIQASPRSELNKVYDTLMIASGYFEGSLKKKEKKEVEPDADTGRIRRDSDFVDMEKQISKLKEELKESHLRSAFLSEQNEKDRKKFDDFLAKLWMERGRPEGFQEILEKEMGEVEKEKQRKFLAMEEALKNDEEGSQKQPEKAAAVAATENVQPDEGSADNSSYYSDLSSP